MKIKKYKKFTEYRWTEKCTEATTIMHEKQVLG